jgi:hypothetical protein
MNVSGYAIPQKDRFTLDMPEGYRILTVEAVRSSVILWVLVDQGKPTAPVGFRLLTPETVIDPGEAARLEYIGTFRDIWSSHHLFRVRELG